MKTHSFRTRSLRESLEPSVPAEEIVVTEESESSESKENHEPESEVDERELERE
jgi:hypothetical protein